MLKMPGWARFWLAASALACSTGWAQSDNALDPADFDSATAACADFYQHAGGGWLARQTLAPGQDSWSRLDALTELGLQQQRQLLDALPAAPDNPLDALLANLWRASQDSAGIEQAGLAPLQPLLASIEKIQKPRELAATIATLHSLGLPLVFNFGADLDLRDFGRSIAYATQGGLGLPDPAFYTRQDDDTRALLGRYRGHIERLLALSGTPAAQLGEQSGWVLGLEMRLASASLSLVELRDPYNAYRPSAVAELVRGYPELRWRDYLKTQKLARLDPVSLAHTRFFAALDQAVAQAPAAHWRAYLRAHLLNILSPYLGADFRAAHFELYGKMLAGATASAEPWREHLSHVDALLGDALGQRYVETRLPGSALAEARSVVMAVRDAAGLALAGSSWLSDEAKRAAAEKLATLRIEVGMPSHRLDYSGLNTRADAPLVGHALAIAGWQHDRELAGIGRTVPLRWPVPTHIPAIGYDLALNRLTVSAAILQPPVFSAGGDLALNFGALGALAGHEISHAFDGKGRSIDGTGQFRDWWLPADNAAFDQRASALESQLDRQIVMDGIRVSGRNTRAEALADLAGLEFAWAAFKAQPAGETIGAQSPDQRFFLGWARLLQRKFSPDSLRLGLASDVRPPPGIRVNTALANLPGFADAFACQAGPMRQPEPIVVWR